MFKLTLGQVFNIFLFHAAAGKGRSAAGKRRMKTVLSFFLVPTQECGNEEKSKSSSSDQP